MKTHCTTLAAALVLLSTFSILNSAFAAVPLEWNATPRNPAPAAFDRHHGETLDFRCTFTGFGELPFALDADVRLWYQTNGMGAAWWSVPATVSSNVLAATFPPQADPGADRLALFFGAPSNAYASAVLRLRPSPGFTPNVLPAPESGYTETDPVFAAWLATNDMVHTETDPTVPEWAKSEIPPQTMTTNDVQNIVTNETVAGWSWTYSGLPSGAVVATPPYFTNGGSELGWWTFEFTSGGGEYQWFASLLTEDYQENATVLPFDCYCDGVPASREVIATRSYKPSRNAIGLARLADLPPLTNGIPDAAARAVYDVHDLMWDETESILYWHKIRQGHDEYIAVTNIDLTHPTNAVILKAWREANQ